VRFTAFSRSSVLLFGLAIARAAALDPHLQPSGNFDLTHWYLCLPVDASGGFSGRPLNIKTGELCAGYSNPTYFYTGKDGAMIFEVPWNGANISGSPRCEFRETHPDGSHFDWTPRSEGGTHILEATCAVNAVGKGKIAIGQIHGKEPNIPTVILRYDNTKSRPLIYVTVKQHPEDAISQERHDFPGVPLNARIRYQLKMVGAENNLKLYVTVNGSTASFDMTDLEWLKTTQYFKAGAYYTVPEKGMTAKVSFYDLKIRHSAGE
jgi:poly(beta-D-mannuronate) lyase